MERRRLEALKFGEKLLDEATDASPMLDQTEGTAAGGRQSTAQFRWVAAVQNVIALMSMSDEAPCHKAWEPHFLRRKKEERLANSTYTSGPLCKLAQQATKKFAIACANYSDCYSDRDPEMVAASAVIQNTWRLKQLGVTHIDRTLHMKADEARCRDLRESVENALLEPPECRQESNVELIQGFFKNLNAFKMLSVEQQLTCAGAVTLRRLCPREVLLVRRVTLNLS